MAKFHMRGFFPETNRYEYVINVLNDFEWNITLNQKGKLVKVFAGEGLLFQGTAAECEALLTGMATTLVVLPENIQNEIKRLIE